MGERMNKPKVDAALAKDHGLSPEEFQLILTRLDREPTWEELGVISVMWSEHCSYKSSRRHLKKLPTEAPWVLQGPGENAGVIEVGEGQAVCFKMESHNHPSFIEPFQGAATGVGGIMRDIFTMGARPIANMNSLRFGSPDAPRMRFLIEGVVAGIGGYGNCMGVPTVGGEVAFDESYNGNILVNAFTLGVLPADRIFRSGAAHVGAPVVYVGSKTGRDGIHGATMASEEFGAESEAKRPRVQVGDPFTEKKLLEACMELMREDAIIAIQDMGAAGLTCSTCEMASMGGMGIEIDVLKVPRRETGMTPYEVLLSESQERMLMVVKPGSEAQVEAIFGKWDLAVSVIGSITDTGQVVVKEGEQTVVNVPAGLLVDDAPNYDRPYAQPTDLGARQTPPNLAEGSMQDRLQALMARPTIASKRWIWEQYDWSVRNGTVRGPGAADAAVVRLPTADGAPRLSHRGVAMTLDVNGRYVYLDPKRGAQLAILESACNLACVGALPRAVTDCLNFGNPEKPDVMWTLVEAIEGLAIGCEQMDTPVISGNVSLYNETEGTPILPTPTIGMVGIIEDLRKIPGAGFSTVGDKIVRLGDPQNVSFGGSELALMETGALSGRPAEPDFALAKKVHETLRKAIDQGLLKSAHDAAEGGPLVALAEACILGGLGARVERWTAREAFAEGPSLVIASCSAGDLPALQALAQSLGAPCAVIGEVEGDRLVIEGEVDVPVESLKNEWAHGLTRAMGRSEAQDNNGPKANSEGVQP